MFKWLKTYFDSTTPDSSKALVLWVASITLCLVALSIGGAIAWHIIKAGDAGGGAVGALLGSSGALTGLAGFHKQGDSTPNKQEGE
jgi:hypothetical protein